MEEDICEIKKPKRKISFITCAVISYIIWILSDIFSVTFYSVFADNTPGGVSGLRERLAWCVSFQVLEFLSLSAAIVFIFIALIKSSSFKKNLKITFTCLVLIISSFLIRNSFSSYISPCIFLKEQSKENGFWNDVKLVMKKDSGEEHENVFDDVTVKTLCNKVTIKNRGRSNVVTMTISGIECTDNEGQKIMLLISPGQKQFINKTKIDNGRDSVSFRVIWNEDFMVVNDISIGSVTPSEEKMKQEQENEKEQFLSDSDISTLADRSWYDESQSEFTISTANQLAGFTSLVNAGNDFSSKTVKLGADIDLSGYTWLPTGFGDVYFSGTFDGMGHTITGLTINGGTQSNIALFGQANDAVIRDLSIENCFVKGQYYVSALVAHGLRCSIEKCHTSGDIHAAAGAGGITGDGGGFEIKDCVSECNINCSSDTGGISGSMTGSEIENCIFNGFINSQGDQSSAAIAGVCGIKSIISDQYKVEVTDCYYNIDKCPSIPALNAGQYVDESYYKSRNSGISTDEIDKKIKEIFK